MSEAMNFIDKDEFEAWLQDNHDSASGTDIFLYKKGYEDQGLTYEDAVRTALCYGWIDAVTHSHDELRFRQYFAPRRQNSNWSLSNKIRVRDLLNEGRMTKYGLKFFDMSWLENLDADIEAELKVKASPVILPDYFAKILEEKEAMEIFINETKSSQRRYISYIKDAKKEATRIRRCHKIVEILYGGKNNL